MKSRISFFNKAIFRKNITRFFPLWALYTIYLLLVLAAAAQDGIPARTARQVVSFMGPVVWINLIYGFLCAALLMGDLFRGRMCNALHALPLRRETWLGTHIVTGLLFCLVPNGLVSIIAALLMPQYAYITLFWLGIIFLQFLFFFGTALFAAACAGSWLGMAAVYGIFHFIAVLLYALAELFYEPLLYGIRLDSNAFYKFFPLTQLHSAKYIDTRYVPTTLTLVYNGIDGESWLYAGVCAAVGIGFMVLALVVYRRRHLESAGDFLSLRPLHPVFLLIYTLGVSAIIFLFSEAFTGDRDYLFAAVGLVVGFFTGQMLLGRTVKVFRKKNFIRFAILIVVFGLSLVLSWLDPLGITRIIPKTDNIRWATIYSSDYNYYYSEVYEYTNFLATDPEDIEKVRQYHSLLVEQQTETDGPSIKVNILYTYKDGRRLARHYEVAVDSPQGQQAKAHFSDIRYIFQTNQPQLLYKHLGSVSVDCYEQELLEKWGVATNPYGYTNLALKDPEQIAGLLDAIAADCAAGNMAQDWAFYSDEERLFSLDLAFSPQWKTNGKYYLNIYESATNTVAYLQECFLAAE